MNYALLKLKVNHYLVEKRLTQAGFADLLGIKQSTLSEMLSNRRPIKVEMLEHICEIIGVNPQEC